METCPTCGGEGSVEHAAPQRDDPYFAVVKPCPECNGSGWVATGHLPEDFEIEAE